MRDRQDPVKAPLETNLMLKINDQALGQGQNVRNANKILLCLLMKFPDPKILILSTSF